MSQLQKQGEKEHLAKSLKILKGGNHNPSTEEKQTTQCSTEKVQNDKQRSSKLTLKTRDRVTRTTL